jgi:hypothetical protein
MWPSRRLLARGASSQEVFAKQAAGVCELHSAHLAEVDPVPALTWWIRLIPVEDQDQAVTDFGVEPAQSTWGEGEVSLVAMDRQIVDLPAAERPRRYLDWLQGHLLRRATGLLPASSRPTCDVLPTMCG